jgi:hypothetical protein
MIKRIVAPRTTSKAYPDGADYFELQSVSLGRGPVAYFYYAPDVDKQDFENLKKPTNVFRVNLDGTGFRKVPR